jgi:hypothetical protein
MRKIMSAPRLVRQTTSPNSDDVRHISSLTAPLNHCLEGTFPGLRPELIQHLLQDWCCIPKTSPWTQHRAATTYGVADLHYSTWWVPRPAGPNTHPTTTCTALAQQQDLARGPPRQGTYRRVGVKERCHCNHCSPTFPCCMLITDHVHVLHMSGQNAWARVSKAMQCAMPRVCTARVLSSCPMPAQCVPARALPRNNKRSAQQCFPWQHNRHMVLPRGSATGRPMVLPRGCAPGPLCCQVP